ncbi:hypothetical protein Poly41_24510 [Novipirellula artificiosorum]|uniref:Uncharacterized protein n=1 Tax=Novipirellula artificiosorum TaxID=2528016 RepID=A0A5C6DX49_9BACT|nr:hypothetical protein Poly41_24510 [Novipirellula artificiosorum]
MCSMRWTGRGSVAFRSTRSLSVSIGKVVTSIQQIGSSPSGTLTSSHSTTLTRTLGGRSFEPTSTFLLGDGGAASLVRFLRRCKLAEALAHIGFSAHPAEGCAGGFRGISPVSHHCWQELFSLVIVQLPVETESSSAEVQLDKGYPGRRCAKGATGSLRTTDRRGLFSKRSLDTGAIPPKNLESGFRALRSDEPVF